MRHKSRGVLSFSLVPKGYRKSSKTKRSFVLMENEGDCPCRFFFNNEFDSFVNEFKSGNIELCEHLSKIYPETYLNEIKSIIENLITFKDDNDKVNLYKNILLKIRKLPAIIDTNDLKKIITKIDTKWINSSYDLAQDLKIKVVGFFQWLYDTLEGFKKRRITLNEIVKQDLNFKKCILLVGPPGTGKTFIPQSIAEYLQVPFISVSCNIFDTLNINGCDRTWNNAKESIFASKLINYEKIPCIVLLDEVDKSMQDGRNNLIDIISNLTDPKLDYTDPYLNIPIYQLRFCIFFLTANDENEIPDYLLSRCEVIKVKQPQVEKMIEIIIESFKFDKEKFIKRSNDIILKAIYSDKVKSTIYNYAKMKTLDIRSLKLFLNNSYQEWLVKKKYMNENISFEDYLLEKINNEINHQKKCNSRKIGFV